MHKLFEELRLPEDRADSLIPERMRERMFARSEEKYEALRDDLQPDGETQTFTAIEVRPRRLHRACIGLAACAVLAAGIGGIWMLRSHAPENLLAPGETVQTEGCYDLPEGAVFPLAQGTALFFADEAHAPAYYRISSEWQTAFIDYISNVPIEYLPNDGSLAVMAGGDRFRMYLETGGVKSTVTFWENGKIVQSFPDGSGDVLWWETQEAGFYDKLTGFLTPERFYKTRFSTFEAMKMNDAEMLNLMFGRSAPFGSFEGGFAVAMEAAYAPYLLTIPGENLDALNTACQAASWRELDGEPALPDGECVILYFWDAREPYSLTFYADSTVRWETGQEVRFFETEQSVSDALAAALDLPDEYAVSHLTWYDPTEDPRMDVWKAMDEAAAQIDMSVYRVEGIWVKPYEECLQEPDYTPGRYAWSVYGLMQAKPIESLPAFTLSWNNWYDHVQGTQDDLPGEVRDALMERIESEFPSDPIDLYPQNPEVWLTCQRGGETIEFVWNNPQMISDGNMPFNCIRFTDADGNISYYEMPESLFHYVIEALSIPEDAFRWD